MGQRIDKNGGLHPLNSRTHMAGSWPGSRGLKKWETLQALLWIFWHTGRVHLLLLLLCIAMRAPLFPALRGRCQGWRAGQASQLVRHHVPCVWVPLERAPPRHNAAQEYRNTKYRPLPSHVASTYHVVGSRTRQARVRPTSQASQARADTSPASLVFNRAVGPRFPARLRRLVLSSRLLSSPLLTSSHCVSDIHQCCLYCLNLLSPLLQSYCLYLRHCPPTLPLL